MKVGGIKGVALVLHIQHRTRHHLSQKPINLSPKTQTHHSSNRNNKSLSKLYQLLFASNESTKKQTTNKHKEKGHFFTMTTLPPIFRLLSSPSLFYLNYYSIYYMYAYILYMYTTYIYIQYNTIQYNKINNIG